MKKLTLLSLFITALGTVSHGAVAENFVPVVHDEPGLRIHAGIRNSVAGEIIHLGDVLTLVVRANWDPDRIAVKLPGDDLFTSAWAKDEKPILISSDIRRVSGTGDLPSGLRAVYRFQLLKCPGTDWSCPGNRDYSLPEFALEVAPQGAGTAAERRQHFKLWPTTLPVATVIPLDDEGQLNVFEKYFPVGGYPEPIRPDESTRASIGAAVGGALLFAGAMLMWPFRLLRRNDPVNTSLPRWQQVVNEMDSDTESSDTVRLEKLRRAVVWYCSDELNVDAFDWIGSRESAPEDGDDWWQLRSLFLELLHDPGERWVELRASFNALTTGTRGY